MTLFSFVHWNRLYKKMDTTAIIGSAIRGKTMRRTMEYTGIETVEEKSSRVVTSVAMLVTLSGSETINLNSEKERNTSS